MHHCRLAGVLALVLAVTTSSGSSRAQTNGEPPLPVDNPTRTLPPGAGPFGPPPAPEPKGTWAYPHYDKGFVMVSTLDPEFPFRLKLNHVSQFKYTNTLAVNKTFTDHLGNVRDVLRRHDIQLTRDVFYFSGFAFSPRLDYNVLLYTSTATLSATAAGYAGYVFSRAFALRAGFFSLPSSREMTGTYPYFHGTDRGMAVNYMRPGFTQGVWAEGEPIPQMKYIAMIGNSLNTLDLTANKIDTHFAYAANVWYDINAFGHPWNDWENHTEPAIRFGSGFTFAPEDRLSDLSKVTPDNSQTYISDGTLLFETGSLAPGVTISLANFYLFTADGGFKYRGFAINLGLFFRWLNHFEADGPLPMSSMFDWGYDFSVGYFVWRHRLEAYGRMSLIKGPFATPVEAGGGLTFYPFATRGVWINVEAMGIHKNPYGSLYYFYSAGQTGFLFQSQFMLRF